MLQRRVPRAIEARAHGREQRRNICACPANTLLHTGTPPYLLHWGVLHDANDEVVGSGRLTAPVEMAYVKYGRNVSSSSEKLSSSGVVIFKLSCQAHTFSRSSHTCREHAPRRRTRFRSYWFVALVSRS